MKKVLSILFFISICNFIYVSCKRPYNPPAIRVDNKFLVFDGVLISNPDLPTVFTLSRTIKLTDTTFSSSAETGALVSVEDRSADNFSFSEQPGGIYKAEHLLLNPSQQYRLKIQTSDGNAYLSDYVDVKQAPPIDSLTWQQQNDVMIYLYTHDAANNTSYYHWDFTETYQYEAPLQAELSQDNGVLFYVDNTPNQTYDCWRSVNSTEILNGTSVALNEDIINKAPIATVPQNSQKISIRYSILVRQYALTSNAYQYLEILKKNTENLGSIFDAQPGQLVGNIHSANNLSEIVIGYFTASNVEQKRLFITKHDVTNWNFVDTNLDCSIKTIDHAPAPDPRFFVYDYPDPDYYPYYFCGATCLKIARRECVDCRVRGGTNQKPSYW